MKIPEVVLFAFATQGEALEVANKVTGEEVCVASIVIKHGMQVARIPVAYTVLPVDFDRRRSKTKNSEIDK